MSNDAAMLAGNGTEQGLGDVAASCSVASCVVLGVRVRCS